MGQISWYLDKVQNFSGIITNDMYDIQIITTDMYDIQIKSSLSNFLIIRMGQENKRVGVTLIGFPKKKFSKTIYKKKFCPCCTKTREF